MVRGADAPRSVALELPETVVADPEMVGDLVKKRVLDPAGELGCRSAVSDDRTAEQRDLAGNRSVVDAPARPRDALVEAIQAAGAGAGELGRRRLVLDDDRDRPEAVTERVG
jgi:hypothetical protein